MPKKTSPGQDKGKTGYSNMSNQDYNATHEEETVSISLHSYAEVMGILIADLDYKGFQLIASPLGEFCGYEVYTKSKLSIPGIKPDDNFWYWKRVDPTNTGERLKFIAAVRSAIEGHLEEASKEEARYWKEVWSCFADKPADVNSKVFIHSRTEASTYYRNKRSALLGTSGGFKFVPKVEWFPVQLQNYDARDLLTLLPDAEAKQLMLLLGRLMAGANGTEAVEGVIEHTFRSMALIVGNTAGMGKSTFLGYISSALVQLGYATNWINTNDTRFGWGEVATTDLAIVDDLTEEVQKRLIRDVRIKSIVSNNYLKVEEKGIAAVSVRATSVVLGCTNLSNYSHYIGMDSGSISRLNQLDTLSKTDLAAKYPHVPDARIKPFWEAKAEEMRVSESVLAMYLLRRSLDLFLEVTGYDVTSAMLVKDRSKDRLEEVNNELRKQFRIDINISHAEELTRVAAHLAALVIADSRQSDRTELEQGLKALEYCPELLLTVAELFIDQAKMPDELKGLALSQMSLAVRKYLKAQISDLRQLAITKTFEEAFAIIIKHFKSTKGFGYPVASSHYQNLWQAEKRQVVELVTEYEKLLENGFKLPKAVRNAMDSMRSLLTEMTE